MRNVDLLKIVVACVFGCFFGNVAADMYRASNLPKPYVSLLKLKLDKELRSVK